MAMVTMMATATMMTVAVHAEWCGGLRDGDEAAGKREAAEAGDRAEGDGGGGRQAAGGKW